MKFQHTQQNWMSDSERTNALNYVRHFHSNERINQNWHIPHNEREFQQFQPFYSRRKLYSDVGRLFVHYRLQSNRTDSGILRGNLFCWK